MSNLKDFKNKNTEFTGTTGIDLPEGDTAARVNEQGRLRFNTDTSLSEYYTGSEWVALSASVKWQSTAKTSDFTAVKTEGYFVDTNAGEVVVTTPASPSVGDEFIIVDLRGTFGTNKCQVDPNGSDKLKGGTVTLDISENYASTRIVYSGATYGWVPVSSAAVAGAPLVFSYSVDYLAVGGGAGGGSDSNDTPANNSGGGGGGAGGFRTGSITLVGGTTYTCSVGAGGVGVSANNGTAGTASSITGGSISISAAGGGEGGGEARNGGDGGSGGGGGAGNDGPNGSGGSGNTPSVSPSQGNSGGGGIGPSTFSGGGGGGASNGGTAANSQPNGGNGTASSITGSSVTYAGGGGGGTNNLSGGSGGSGGGGNGTQGSGSAGSGTDGLGGGGGGRGTGAFGAGASGGDGVVILSVPTASYSGTTTGSPTITTSGANTILKFESSGTYIA